MKLVSLFLFLLFTSLLSAHPVETDSLLRLLQLKEVDQVIALLTSASETNQEKSNRSITENLKDETILMLSYYLKRDSANYLDARSKILSGELSKKEAEDVIVFVYLSSYKFITNPSVFFLMQDLGISLAKKHNKPRAHFSFLQQKFSMYQMTNQIHRLPDLLVEMRTVSKGSDYLEYLTNMQFSLYYCGIQHDSCTYFFERYLARSNKYLGRPNLFFLTDEGYSLKKDSSIMAGVITEYAKYQRRKGDLKKAGEYIIRSLQVIPDTSTVILIKIKNQLTLANIYTDLVNPTRALFYIEKAIALCAENDLDRLRKTDVASSYAYALMADGQFEQAAVEFTTAFLAYPRSLNCHDPKLAALQSALNAALMHDVVFTQTMLDSAEKINCRTTPDMSYYKAMTNGVLAAHNGFRDQAKHEFAIALSNAKSVNAIGWLKDVLYQEYICDKQFGKVSESIIALEKYADLKDSLYHTGQDVALFDIEASYQKTLQDETIARLDAENEISIAKLNAQKKNLTIVSIALMSLFILLALVWRLYKKVKTTNALLSKAVAEKNILLREIHHRVKNNLQVISSLLKLQSGYIKDDVAIQAIAEGRSRVQSMALLHQNLYQEDNLKGVNMQEYFDHLIQGLFDTYNISPDRILLHKNIEAISLDVDTVVPLGLITNELISNALKHAFEEDAPGNLYVDLFEQSGHLILKVRDDGNGMTNTNTKEGFGSKLIQSLSQKLEADITTRSTHGTEIILTIREYRKAA